LVDISFGHVVLGSMLPNSLPPTKFPDNIAQQIAFLLGTELNQMPSGAHPQSTLTTLNIIFNYFFS